METLLAITEATFQGSRFNNCDEKFDVLKCVEDDKPTFKRFSKALTALANASDVLKTRDYGFSDYDLVMIRKAFEQWGNIWPKSFTEGNITPKGYILSFVLPKSCEELKTFYKFEGEAGGTV